MESLYHTRVDK